MKKEMTAREFFDILVKTIERTSERHSNPQKRTVLVPDEIVRVTTIEITEVVPQGFCELIGREMTEWEIAEYKHRVRDVIIENFGHDDMHINVQQFITKCHEEEV